MLLNVWRNRPEVFCKKIVLKNFAKFTEKHLCQRLSLNKVAGLRPVTLFKRRPWHRGFTVNFAKFLRTLFFIEHLWWLLFCNVFFLSHFSCCLLLSMFHSRGKNNKIKRLHKRCLRIVYSDKKSTSIGVLEKDNPVSIRRGNLYFFAIETFKFKRGLAPALCKEMISQNRTKR